MIRNVPYGLQVGQVIRPLVASEMTNGKIAPAGALYEIRIIYPGGVIVASQDAPGGLLRAGTPVHVEGESEATAEELERFRPADAPSQQNDITLTGGWDYRICSGRAIAGPRQAAVICEILVESGKTEFSESEILRLLKGEEERFRSKQESAHIFKYYRKDLIAAGFLIKRVAS